MSLFNLFKNNQKSVKDIAGVQFDYPEQIDCIGLPKDHTVFQAVISVMDLTVIEKKYKDTSYREIYVIDFNLVGHLKSKDYKVKRMDVIKTEEGELRVVLQTKNFSNSWIDSNLEAMELAKEQPIYITRDRDAGVYESTPVDTLLIPITDSDIEEAFHQSFGKYQIDSLEHPVLQEILGTCLSGDVVDSLNVEDDSDGESPELHVEKEIYDEALVLKEIESFDINEFDDLNWESVSKQVG